MPRQNPESTPSTYQLRSSEKPTFVRKVGVGLGAMAMSITGSTITALDIDTKLTYAFDTLDPPTTSVLDQRIVSAPNPEQEARFVTVNPELIERCRRSDFVIVHFSGTSMETSHYAASVYDDLVKEFGGCSMYHWSGYKYDMGLSAQSVESAIDEVTPDGEKKTIILIGSSLGGTLAQDVASDEAVVNSDSMDIKRVVIIASPKDLDDIDSTILGVIPVSWLQHLPQEISLPIFGRIPLLAQAIGGQIVAGQIRNPQAWQYTIDNVSKTRPQLTHSELERIRHGMYKIRSDIKIDYIGSSVNDGTVNVLQASDKMSQHAELTYTELEAGAVHGDAWLVSASQYYSDILKKIFEEIQNENEA